MRRITRLAIPLMAIAAAVTMPAFAADEKAADDAGLQAPPPVAAPVTRLICTPKALGLVCSTTNIRAAVAAGWGGRSQTLTAAPYPPYMPPRGRALAGFDIDLTLYASRSDGGRIFMLVDVGGDARVFDLTDRVQPDRGGIRSVKFSTGRALIAQGTASGEDTGRLPIHLMLTAQTRAAADTARLDVIEIEMQPR
jgi:hypothetical protein